jgi:hypothetical protein
MLICVAFFSLDARHPTLDALQEELIEHHISHFVIRLSHICP